MAEELKAYRVQLKHRLNHSMYGRIQVLATGFNDAVAKAPWQVVEVSYPESRPGDWIVQEVRLEGGK